MLILSVIAMLAVLIFLVCLPQERRPHFLRKVLIVGGAALAAYYVVPIIVGLLFAAVGSLLDYAQWFADGGHSAWVHSAQGSTIIRYVHWASFAICGAGVLFFVVLVGGAATWDALENRAIRAGSVKAFDKRMQVYMDTLNCSREEALEITTRIRDGKQSSATPS